MNPEARRMAMVDRLSRTGVVRTEAVARALREVPRHTFLGHLPVAVAYEDRAVTVKRAGDGPAISSISQPTMVALMLEDLQVREGHQVLEVGAGTGYNAALLAILVGSAGSVVSVELEPDLAQSARRHLSEVGADYVEVVTGDGSLGHPARSPYDRIIVTAGARSVAPAWTQQLVEGGRMVVPIVDAHGKGSVIVFDKVGGELVSGHETLCGFVPIRHTPIG